MKKISEDQKSEWKEIWKDDFLKVLCGFANSGGGTLVIGQSDAGKVIGVDLAARLLEEIPNKARDLLGIMVTAVIRRKEGKELVQISVPDYPNAISYRGEYFCRSGSTTQALKGGSLDRFLLRRQGRHWDGVTVPATEPADCAMEAIREFCRRATTSGRMDKALLKDRRGTILGNLELTEAGRLKRAACLLFPKREPRIVPGAWIKIGYFASDDDLRYQDEVRGNLFTQVERTMELLHAKYLKASIRYEGLQRIEGYPYPAEALREALLNAVVHKDYGSGIPIQISVYDEKLVFWNPGELPEDWTLRRLLGKHPSCPPNPLIANTFFRAGYIESWGRGIEKIARECREHGMEPPVYDAGMSGLMVTFRAPDEYLSLVGTTPGNAVKTLGKTLGKTPDRIHDLLLRNPSLTVPEIARTLQKSESAVQRAILRLQSEKRLIREGPRKGGSWKIVS